MPDAGVLSADAIAIISSVLDAKDEAALSSRLDAATRCCGFEMFMIGVEAQGPNGAVTRHVTGNYPLAWQQAYLNGKYAEIDPTVAHLESCADPIVWTASLFDDAGARPLPDAARGHGIKHGISLPTHERVGTKSMLTLARDQAVGDDPREAAGLLAAVRVLSSCAHFAASRLLSAKLRDAQGPALTSQERCCLRWVSIGKTSWEVGQIMSISEPTVIFHLKNVMKKLNVSNRAQALASAMRLGYLD